jgi:hypothetical protein
MNSMPVDYEFGSPSISSDLLETRKLETKRRHLDQRYNKVLEDVIRMEVKMGISQQWQPSMPEYVETAKYMANRQFHQALNNLQRLVVQCLFELHKLNISQTGLFLAIRRTNK